jgi:RNA polymerase sigma-70 factor (ECF subfamily)
MSSRSTLRGRPAIRGEAEAGNAVELAALYERYREPLLALCVARLRDRALAEDVVQDVFVKAFAVLPRLDDDRPAWPLLASIAARDCIDAHRRRVLGAARHDELAGAPGRAATAPDAERAAMGRLAQEAVTQEIEALLPRQRAALLFAVEGWTYADIAERLGCSIGAVKLLVLRARKQLLRARARVLGGLGTAGQGILARLQGLVDRAGALAPWAARLGGCVLGAIEGPAAAAVGLAVAGVVGLSVPSAAPAAMPSRAAVTSPAADPAPAAGVPAPARPAPEAGPRLTPEPVVQAHGRAAQQAVDETAAPLAAPKSGQVLSMTVSPGYDRDRTVFAVDGTLSVSRDGGASWSRLRALGLGARRLLLPPAYPRDSRMLAIGGKGLQLSDDGGDSFQTVAPGHYVDAALSPGFDEGDPVVLMVSQEGTLARYDGRRGLTEPVLLDERLAGHVVNGVGYDAADPSHRTIRLVSWDASFTSSHLSQCTLGAVVSDGALIAAPTRLTCTTRQLAGFRSAWAGLGAPAPGGGALVVSGQYEVLMSTDGGRTLRRTSGWNGSLLDHWHVAVVPGAPMSLVVARSSHPGEPALLRTDDGGATWVPLFVEAPGFEPRQGAGGAIAVAVTPTGRILAGGMHGGLACSADGGRTWAPLCPTPDA